MITGTTTQISRTVAALTSLLQLVTAVVVALGLLAGWLLIDWAVALCAAGLFGSLYCLLAVTTRKEVQRNSQLIAAAARQQIKALQEALGQGLLEVCLNSPGWVAAPTLYCAGTAPDPWPPSPPARLLMQAI